MAAATRKPGPKQKIKTSGEQAQRAAEMLKAVAHPIRLRIVAILCEGEQHVSALAELLDAKQTIVSQQLRILRMHRLVEVIRTNGHAYYQIAEPHLRDLIRCVEGCAGPRR